MGKEEKPEVYTNKELVSLYLEQIKYLRQENVSIQDKFLSMSPLNITALGVIFYTMKDSSPHIIYLLLPFLYYTIPYNIIKYTIRMLGINGYIKELEKRINRITEEETFMWNRSLINVGHFGLVTTAGQIPLHLVVAGVLGLKFYETWQANIVPAWAMRFLFFMLLVEAIATMWMLYLAVTQCKRTKETAGRNRKADFSIDSGFGRSRRERGKISCSQIKDRR